MYRFETKLALGSANFGLDYGLTNKGGKISKSQFEQILLEAELAGIQIIDTAQAYGDSETRIGSLCNGDRFKIVTKIGVGLEKGYIPNSITKLVRQSCNRLNQSCLYAVLLHRPELLLSDYRAIIIDELQKLKIQKKVSKIGVSIYSPNILNEITKFIDLDIVQAPFNIFDQRILSSGWAEKLVNNNTEIHTRSVFLQGLLLMKQANLPKYFSSHWPELFKSWYEFLKSSCDDSMTHSLGFVLKQPWIDNIVVGVDTVSQLKSLINIEQSSNYKYTPQFNCDDENLIDPSKWKLS